MLIAAYAGLAGARGCFVQTKIDTHVRLGACLSARAPSRVIAACLQGRCLPLMGNALFNEYEDVFGRADLFERCPLNPEQRAELLDIFLARCQWTRVYYAWRPNLPDEADNHLVELAVAGGADFDSLWKQAKRIVASGRHLSGQCVHYSNIRK